jgi:pullulanase
MVFTTALFVVFCLLVSASASAPADEWAGPAFLDAFDEVRVWLPRPSTVAGVQDAFTVRVNGRTVAVKEALGGERAGTPRDPDMVVLAGTVQSALGGSDWDPAGEISRMTRTGGDAWELVAELKAGTYEYKVARGGSWDENYGAGFARSGSNIRVIVPSDRVVRFVVDFGRGFIGDSVNNPNEVTAPSAAPPKPKPASFTGLYQSFRVKLAERLQPFDVCRPIQVRAGSGPWRTVYAREVLSDPVFFYAKDDLGSRWTKERTAFKVWSPVSSKAEVLLYKTTKSPVWKTIPMKRNAQGVWYAVVPGDLHGVFYNYRFESYGETRYAADINGYAASADAQRTMVVDLTQSNPPGWPAPRPFKGRRPTDAVIYEIHVRDLTSHPNSGVSTELRGRYAGLVQKGTRVPGTSFATGFDYLKDLGVTHIQLMPIQNFNPAHSGGYNWGYETTLFNVPEEQYAVRRNVPLETLRETKRTFMDFQRAGMGVVMDVVYNHTVPSEGEWSAFWQTVPYYYFRNNDRGDNLNESGVGNAVHDERPMVRKYIRESLIFWLKEYRVDGFRFDLLGMFTPETVRELVDTIHKANPDAVVTGEPWTGGGPTRFGKGAQRSMPVAVFNDNFRNTFRGELDGTWPGFAMGGPMDRGALERAVAGAIDDFAEQPGESLNYVSAHDNLTFMDRIERSIPNADDMTKSSVVKLAYAGVLLSQGIPFLEGGVEIGRTKGGNHNSYNAGDSANQYDWQRAVRFTDLRDYVRGLVALRKAHPAFRMASRDLIKSALTFVSADQLPAQTFAYRLDGSKAGDRWKDILVILHGGRERTDMRLPEGEWNVVVNAECAGTTPLGTATGTLKLEPLSAVVLFR